MNIENYIATGILEAYVLELLTNEERKKVESLIRRFPELKQERKKIEASLFSYIKAFKLKIPETSKERIICEIEKRILKNNSES